MCEYPPQPGCRVSLGLAIAIIAALSIAFAGLAACSSNWLRTIHSLTILVLFVAAIAARYYGPFWRGFAIVGWGHFLLGCHPWPDWRHHGDNLLTFHYLDSLCRNWMLEVGMSAERLQCGIGIGNCLSALAFAFGGGLLFRGFANSQAARWESEARKPNAMTRRYAASALILMVAAILGTAYTGRIAASEHWFRAIYNLTVLVLFGAAFAIDRREPFWHGFAIVGWGYFLLRHGSWCSPYIGNPVFNDPNDHLWTSHCLFQFCNWQVPPWTLSEHVRIYNEGNRVATVAHYIGVGHCLLTLVFATAGGWLSRHCARRQRLAIRRSLGS